ncbi:MAG: hypothetical protein K0Q95_1428 [Bacteroidota bacterium]|nr:hypothetical protein [Bacteroidota bacterium]
MRKRISIALVLMALLACKKEQDPLKHLVECTSNISDRNFYTFSINGSSGNELSQIYTVSGNTDISLILLNAGGDTTVVNSGDSLWVRGGIIVDGRLVRNYAGYRDATLTYHIDK